MILLFNPWRFSPTLHYKKQNLGLMVNGLATITYDKTTIDTSNSVTNATSQSTTLEGHYADFDVYQYDYSGQTTTDSQTSHEFTQVAFDSTATTHWSLVSYTSIQTVGTGLSYAEESVFDMWQHITTTGDYSVNTWIYEHSRERDHSGSSHLTTTYETHGHSMADGSGGYSFVYDSYSVNNSYSEESAYTNVGYASLLSETTNTPPIGPPSYHYEYSRFDWDKDRDRESSESDTIAGTTSGATFTYSTYSRNNSRNDTGHFDGGLYIAATGFIGLSWSRQTLVFDETMDYDYTAGPSDYSVSIEYEAPYTLVQSGTFLSLYTTTDVVTRDHTETGTAAKPPPAPVEVAQILEGAKVTEYYGLGAGVIASNSAGPGDDPNKDDNNGVLADSLASRMREIEEERNKLKGMTEEERFMYRLNKHKQKRQSDEQILKPPDPRERLRNGMDDLLNTPLYPEDLMKRYPYLREKTLGWELNRLRQFGKMLLSGLGDQLERMAGYPLMLIDLAQMLYLCYKLDSGQSVTEDELGWALFRLKSPQAQEMLRGLSKGRDLGVIYEESLRNLIGDAAVLLPFAKFQAQGKAVLGSYPWYLELADELRAKRFSIPSEVWKRMTPAEQWAANQKFLDLLIAGGDEIILSNNGYLARETSSFYKEIQYMISKGYRLSKDGFRLLPPSR